jgi:16S rRNA processing protein RimM
MHNQYVLIKFKGYDDRTAVDALRGQMLSIPRELAVPLGEDEYYTADIIGLEVYLENGDYIGKIVNIIETGSNDVYVAQKGKEQTLIPALKRVVKLIDLKAQKMVVIKEEELEVR